MRRDVIRRNKQTGTFKIVTGIYDTVVSQTMLVEGLSYVTRDHDFRLQKISARYDLHKYCFTNRVVNMWNSLSSYVVSAVFISSSSLSLVQIFVSNIIDVLTLCPY